MSWQHGHSRPAAYTYMQRGGLPQISSYPGGHPCLHSRSSELSRRSASSCACRSTVGQRRRCSTCSIFWWPACAPACLRPGITCASAPVAMSTFRIMKRLQPRLVVCTLYTSSCLLAASLHQHRASCSSTQQRARCSGSCESACLWPRTLTLWSDDAIASLTTSA